MSTPEESLLAKTFENRQMSRGERQALAGLAAAMTPEGRAAVARRAFDLAREALASPDDRPVLEWLEGVVAATRERPDPGDHRGRAEAHFSPGEDCPRAILRLLAGARRSVDACVFTITDDRLADALGDAHRRGVAVRVITDNSKADDLGSDADRLAAMGVAVRVDHSPFHMHHKFAVIDGTTLMTGSYNWTRGASRDNEENLIVADDPRLVSPFVASFASLWARFA